MMRQMYGHTRLDKIKNKKIDKLDMMHVMY